MKHTQGMTIDVMEEEASSVLSFSLSLRVAVVSEARNEMKVK